MTRKTRTRRPRIQSIQSGYCEICHIPYNSIEDHIQSKRHQKLIGEDAGYIAINGFLNQDANIESFLNLNLDPLGHHGLDGDVSPKSKRRTMPRTRAASVACDKFKEPVSPANSEIIGHHHLRSRRQINYMTPPLDDDSLPESDKLDFSPPPRLSPTPTERLRTSARVLARLSEKVSGRPRRSCLRARRNSTEERLLSDAQRTFYKVEEVKPRVEPVAKPKTDDKGLIVKFKKREDDSSGEDERDEDDADADGANTTASSGGHRNSTLLLSDEDGPKFKVEEDGTSMDSVDLENRRRRKRRTHAEAFITDNHKYYKFEMPGSRLRYHGSFLNDSIKSSKNNGDCPTKVEKDEPAEDFKLKLDNYIFSFETVPKHEQWYNTFLRQDLGQMRLPNFSDFYWDSFVLPYQMGHIPPLDPKKCITQYNQIKKLLLEPPSSTPSAGSSTPDHYTTTSTSSKCPDEMDEDSKTSTVTTASCSSKTEDPTLTKKRKKHKDNKTSSPSSRNPRKSPRQHASTLAILSSLLKQRKAKTTEESRTLPVIPEEPRDLSPAPKRSVEEVCKASPRIRKKYIVCSRKPKIFQRKKPVVPKVDYNLLATRIEEEINGVLELDEPFEEIEQPEDCIEFNKGSIKVSDIVDMCERERAGVPDETSIKRLLNASPGRKPGKRKKKNLTGWPNNKHRRLLKRLVYTKRQPGNEENSTNGSCSARNSDEETESPPSDTVDNGDEQCDDATNDVHSVDENCDCRDRVDAQNDKILTVKITNSDFQPFVCVQKIGGDKLAKPKVPLAQRTKRASRRQRRMPGSPRSPRILRKPRGRWYRER